MNEKKRESREDKYVESGESNERREKWKGKKEEEINEGEKVEKM